MIKKSVYMPVELWNQAKQMSKFFSKEEDMKISVSEVIRRALVELSFKYEKFKKQ